MPRNEYHFVAISKVTFEHESGARRSKLLATDLRFEVSENLDRTMYLDKDDLPIKDAIKPITIALVSGLIANIRFGAHKGWWKEADHIRFAIDELQRLFVDIGGTPTISKMEY